jgi:c-di-GMP-binding flagellar brake protein YcgR
MINTIEVVYVQGNPYPYLQHKPVTLLNGQTVNATCMTKGNQAIVFIAEHEIIRRERIPVEPWM